MWCNAGNFNNTSVINVSNIEGEHRPKHIYIFKINIGHRKSCIDGFKRYNLVLLVAENKYLAKSLKK
jgi:hypothetical protein